MIFLINKKYKIANGVHTFPGFLSIHLFFNSFFDTPFYIITYRERCILKYNKFKNPYKG